MPNRLNVGVIGLGVMGQRMLDRIKDHPRLCATMVWDANPDTLGLTRARHPEVQAAHSAEQVIHSAGLHSVYIATPPAAHMALSQAALDAGLAVFCEKPLTVDFDAARRVIRKIEEGHHRAAVNYSLAASAGLALLQQTFGTDSARPLGNLHDVRIALDFAAWPRPWQAAAGEWLSLRTEGGFAREVLSHFIFVLQRVLGPATVWNSAVTYPVHGMGAETAMKSSLRAAEVPVQVTAKVDSAVPVAEHNEMVWRAEQGAIVLRDWYGLLRLRRGGDVETLGEPDVLRAAGQSRQMDQWVALIEGDRHELPSFAEALDVQETIEALLRAR